MVIKSKTKLFISIATVALTIVIILDLLDDKFSYHDILVEFHGLVFDLIVFGVILTIYEIISLKNESIERYQEELNDYRFWKSPEAFYRIRGIVKRLITLGVKKIDLSHCQMSGEKSLSQYKSMKEWNFSAANLSESFFILNNMDACSFCLTDLTRARFESVKFSNCNFKNSILIDTKFIDCAMNEIDLDGAIVNKNDWFLILLRNNNQGVELLNEKYVFIEIENSLYKLNKK